MNGEKFVWAGGQHRFFLHIGQLRALQQACDAGPMHIFMRITAHQWMVDDIIETIILGLMGGEGMTESDARSLVHRVIEEENPGKLAEHASLALEIIRVSILMVETDETEDETDSVGKPTAETDSAKNGTSDQSTNPAYHLTLPPVK